MKQLFKCEKCGKEFVDSAKCARHEILCGKPRSKRYRLITLRLCLIDPVKVQREAVTVYENDPDVDVQSDAIVYRDRIWNWTGTAGYYRCPSDGEFDDTLAYINYVDGHVSDEEAFQRLKECARQALVEELAERRSRLGYVESLLGEIDKLKFKEDKNGKR